MSVHRSPQPSAGVTLSIRKLTAYCASNSSSESDVDYASRRMSSSATSADTDSSAVAQGEKRSATPSNSSSSPFPSKKHRSSPSSGGEHPQKQNGWDVDTPSTTPTSIAEEKPSAIDGGTDNPKVQLPSIFTTFEDTFRSENNRRASLPTHYSESAPRRAPPTITTTATTNATNNANNTSARTNNYHPVNQSSLSSYQFPQSDSALADSPYPHSALSTATTPSSSTFPSSATSTFNSPLTSSDYRQSLAPQYPENGDWNSSPGIVRPSSTPGQLSAPLVNKYDGMRHASFSGPIAQNQMFAGSTRISGQDRSRTSFSTGVKSEWSFPNPDFVLPSSNTAPVYHHHPSSSALTPPIAAPVSSNATRSPASVPSSTLVDRPQRKRGKLPKETTDFLKTWLHRHSDHPYPSEDEKKQLCHATGLSMSQVSNWMINARRRILAPAHRAASGPTTTAPFPSSTSSSRTTNLLDPSRRASMPTDSLQLYHPMSLQSLPTNGNADYGGRQVLGMPRSSYADFSRLGTAGGGAYLQPSPYSAGPHLHPGHHAGGYMGPSGVPLSAPPTLSSSPFSSQHQHQQQQHHQQHQYGHTHHMAHPSYPDLRGPAPVSNGHPQRTSSSASPSPSASVSGGASASGAPHPYYEPSGAGAATSSGYA